MWGKATLVRLFVLRSIFFEVTDSQGTGNPVQNRTTVDVMMHIDNVGCP